MCSPNGNAIGCFDQGTSKSEFLFAIFLPITLPKMLYKLQIVDEGFKFCIFKRFSIPKPRNLMKKA